MYGCNSEEDTFPIFHHPPFFSPLSAGGRPMSKEKDDYGHGTEKLSLNADPKSQRSREIEEKRWIENWQRKHRYELTVADIQNKNQELNYKKLYTGDKEREWIT